MLMGLVIDYAIHFMYWYKKKGNIMAAYDMTASPIIFNGISLIICFVVLLTAPLMLYVRLALLMILGIAMGVLTTLVFLPQILVKKKIKWGLGKTDLIFTTPSLPKNVQTVGGT